MARRNRPKRKFLWSNYLYAGARAGIFLASCVIAQFVWAQELIAPEGSIEVGIGRTDNLNRNDDEIEADIGSIAVGFAGSTERRWIGAGLSGLVEYRHYDADESLGDDDSEVLGTVDGVIEMYAVPDRVQWDVRASLGQVRIDPFGPMSPINRQQTTAFSTGPEIKIPIGQRTLVDLVGLISDQSFEKTPDLDAQSKAIRLSLERQLSVVTRLSLSGEVREIEYDLDAQEHEITTLMLEYRRDLASGEAFASIGRGLVEVNNIDADPVTVGRLVWKRSVGARSRVELCVGREITDAGNAFVSAGVAVSCPGDLGSLADVARVMGSRGDSVIPTTTPLVRDGGSLSFEVDGTFGSFRATGSLARDRFREDSTFDNDWTIFEVTGSREFASRWRVELIARYSLQDFIEQDEENEGEIVRASLSRLLTPNMRVSFSYERGRRVGGVGPYKANDYFLSIGREFGQ